MGWDRSKQTLRNHFETKRLAVVTPGGESEGRHVKRTTRWVEHKRCFTWTAGPAQAGQAIHMCDLDRAGTVSVTSLAVEEFRQCDGDEPVNDEQKSWLRNLVGVLGSGDGRCTTLSRTS